MFIADKQYWQTADKRALVDASDPRAAFLFVGKGHPVSDADAKKFGLGESKPTEATTESALPSLPEDGEKGTTEPPVAELAASSGTPEEPKGESGDESTDPDKSETETAEFFNGPEGVEVQTKGKPEAENKAVLPEENKGDGKVIEFGGRKGKK